jgi:hypothetical protein
MIVNTKRRCLLFDLFDASLRANRKFNRRLQPFFLPKGHTLVTRRLSNVDIDSGAGDNISAQWPNFITSASSLDFNKRRRCSCKIKNALSAVFI